MTPSIDPKFKLSQEHLDQFPGLTEDQIQVRVFTSDDEADDQFGIEAIGLVNGAQVRVEACPRPCPFVNK